ncbi:hypothetical protein DI09_75p140 [Mitosporidium daphniae]|uniref:RRM domain-containing protein n=1 Tax=Mitosporidium daphniae TaxID=1485682 RepID=A0A098VNK8_9MICR|nr:uncharacterized protein DI09_75p140 [Mitosporidium daphniae]KGG50354.1 hypothetical protein DI09_75p140 [Mitosporidium daphniae]|eukprot:XP_013236781.1 uncharacterized protein DI09_75p140 [Mitosporidium daphniae]
MSTVAHQYSAPPSMAPPTSGIVAGEGTFVGVPSSTLYVQNLNEKSSISLLQKELFYAFCPFGKILDIKIKKNMKMKGQAFVAFDSVEEASKALVARQGSIILHKPIVVRFARFKSYISSKKDQDYEEQRSRQDEYKSTFAVSNIYYREPVCDPEANQVTTVASNLDVPNIPSLEAPEERLNSLFASHLGFKEVRLVPSKKDIAFVEYENDVFANAARLALDKYQILPSHEIRTGFATNYVPTKIAY